jgi:hypothetical protein
VPDNRRRMSQPATPPSLSRLDAAAENLNPFLIVIVIGLALLNFSVFAALELRNLPLRQISDTSDAVPPNPLTLGEAIGFSRH